MNESKNQKILSEILNSKEKSSYFVAAVTVIFTISILLLGVIPSYSAFTAQANENQKKSELISKARKKNSDLINLSKELDSNQRLVDNLLKVLPSDKDQKQVYQEISALIIRNSQTLRSINFVENAKPSRKYSQLANDVKFKTVGISLLVESQNPNFSSLVRDIETSLRVYDITNTTMTRIINDSQIPIYQLNLQMNYFYYEI